MDLEEKRFRDAENLLNQSGYTLAEFLRDSSRYKSTLLMLPDDELRAYQKLYADIATGGLSKGEKGKKLEELSTILFQKSAGSLLAPPIFSTWLWKAFRSKSWPRRFCSEVRKSRRLK